MAVNEGLGLAPATSARAGRWSVWADRVGGEPLGGMVVTGLRYGSQLSGFGTGEATVAVTESPLDHDDLLRLWSWRLWVSWDGRPYWCGLPSSVTDDTGVTVSLGFTEIHGYLTRRAYDVAGGHRYDQVEQTEIARQLAAPVADVGVGIVTDPGPGFPRDRQYEYLENYRSELLVNLANVVQGPEFRMDYSLAAFPEARLRIAYPGVGSAASELGLVVPGNAVSPSLTYDGEELRTRTFAVGDAPEAEEGTPEGQEPPRPVYVVDRPQPYMPRLDRMDEWPGVILMETLRDRANTNATLYAAPALEVQAQVPVTDPPLSSYAIGDSVAIYVVDPFHSEGMSVAGRLVGLEVDAAAGLATWTLTTTSPPARARGPVTAQVAGLSRAVGSMFRRGAAPVT